MKKVLKIAILLGTVATLFVGTASIVNASNGQNIIYRKGTVGSFEGPAEWCNGKVHGEMILHTNKDFPYSNGLVTFQPKARSNWHTHPIGQMLVVTKCVGYTQYWGGKRETIKEGDSIWCSPTVKHWHGGSHNKSMTHMAITGTKDGVNAAWMEPVTDEQYNKED